MSRIASLFTIMALLITASACGGKKPLEPSTVRTKNVISALRELGQSYERKDLTSFMGEVSSAYQDREQFSRSLSEIFSKYETIRFNIQYAKMIIMIEEKGMIKTSFNWDAEWRTPGGAVNRNGGRVTMSFDPGSFKLVSIDAKNPFLPQTGEVPGK
jgi:hypothetical protein